MVLSERYAHRPVSLACVPFCTSRSGFISDLAMVSARLELRNSLQQVRALLLVRTKAIYIRSPE